MKLDDIPLDECRTKCPERNRYLALHFIQTLTKELYYRRNPEQVDDRDKRINKIIEKYCIGCEVASSLA